MSKLNQLLTWARKFEQKNRASLAAGAGCALFVGAMYETYKVAPKAQVILREHRMEVQKMKEERVPKKEIVQKYKKTGLEVLKMAWKPALLAGVGAVLIMSTVQKQQKHIALLTATYNLTETAFAEYRDKVKELVGEPKEKQVEEALAKDRVHNNPPNGDTSVIETGNGNVLCYEPLTGRYFNSHPEKIKESFLRLSLELRDDEQVTLNDLNFLLNIPGTDLGEKLGWEIDAYERGSIPFNFTAVLTPDNKPCLSISYGVEPRVLY